MSLEMLDEDDDVELKEQKKKHEDFLLAEYSSIAQAYFNTTSTIATFFRNYLVVVGLPIPILGFILLQISKSGSGTGGGTGQSSAITVPPELNLLVPVTACMIAALGFCLMVYVVNLRLDALLYARTVNGLRRYFYDQSPLDYPSELQMRGLPRTITQPRYYEGMYFLPVIFVFALLNTLYPLIGFGWYVFQEYHTRIVEWWPHILIGAVLIFVLHWIAYAVLAWYRESKYLRKLVIGVEIDGALCRHLDFFCTKLHAWRNKSVWADQVTAFPARDCPKNDVTAADEQIASGEVASCGVTPTAVLLSMTASLKRHGINSWVYLTRVLTELPRRPTGSDLADLLPGE